MSRLPRYWSIKNRQPLHPVFPSKSTEWTFFLTASFFMFFFPIYLFTAYRRELLNGSQILRVGLPLAIGGGVFLLIGFGFRWWRLRKYRQNEQSKARLVAGLVQNEQSALMPR